MKKAISNQITDTKPEHFTQHPETLQCIADLKSKFGQNFEGLIVSDTKDEQGNQYVNLVQKGGGILGVALVGYTYILEQAGIRFLRLAGTSAGAINTAMLTVIGKKEEPKSEKILKYLCELNFFNLVDGRPLVRWLIKNFITHKQFNKNLKEWFIGILSILLILTAADFVFLGLRHLPWALIALRISYVLTAIHLIIIGCIIFYTNYLVKALREGGHGLNPGKYFYDWMKNVMEENNVTNVTQLNEKAGKLPKLVVKNTSTHNADSLYGDVTFISSELMSQNKIEFPKMCNLFREDPDDIHPASFVRASMSIPIFFQSHVISNIPKKSQKIKDAWLRHFNSDSNIPPKAHFVDGGMMSDFPISIFYNPRIIEPRLPSFGIDLDDSSPEENSDNNDDADMIPNSLAEYLGGLFDTIRYYYDKDFLIKNNVFKKGIGKIPLAEFNWLNFFITEEEKIKMFIKGAQAARDFLFTFDWRKYQEERVQMQLFFNEKNTPENAV
jgi:NTE family protein